MNKIYIVDLTEEEQARLLNIFKTGKRSGRKINRARILLLADEERAEVLHTSVPTVREQGQFSLGAHRYGVGRSYAGQTIEITFDSPTCLFKTW